METILVVEDEKAMLDTLVDKLKLEGFGVLAAVDGEQGLRTALSDHPDLILLDNRMPNMSGYAMLKKLREYDSWGEKVPVIFFSNVEPSSRDEQADIEAIAPTAYMLKSESGLADIVAKIRETLHS